MSASRETTTEWAVRHSQGIRPVRNEKEAREVEAEFLRREQRIRYEYRGRVRVLRREVTEWEEV